MSLQTALKVIFRFAMMSYFLPEYSQSFIMGKGNSNHKNLKKYFLCRKEVLAVLVCLRILLIKDDGWANRQLMS